MYHVVYATHHTELTHDSVATIRTETIIGVCRRSAIKNLRRRYDNFATSHTARLKPYLLKYIDHVYLREV